MIPLQDAAIRMIDHLVERPDGPMAFRFLIQPVMAAILAIRDGMRDGRTGATPFFLTLILPSGRRKAAWIEAIRATARILILAAVLDVIYQAFVYHAFYPGETVIVAVVLGLLPYVLLRGPVSRIFRMRRRGPVAGRDDEM
jgi:hypothetical protein